MGTALAFFFKGDKPEIDVSAHLPLATNLLLAAIALLLVFFVVRPELWRRMWFDRIDPRPAAVMRIAFGLVVLWTFVDLIRDARFLFTDEGMWLTKMARKNYGGKLSTLWDPEHGFEHWWDLPVAMWGKFSILHFRSDPPYVYTIYTIMLTSLVCMILGIWTRFTTVLSWLLVEQVYRYSPVFYTGGDTVVRVFLFVGIFCRWGEAYSIDCWRRRRKAILGGATEIPAMRWIPAWPQRLMMLQLCIIYSATGLLKSGATWANGTAMYYSLCLDHFYRFKEQVRVAAFLQFIKLLPAMTVSVRWWEVFFPIVLVGVAVNAFEREKADGTWPHAPAWRRLLSYLLFAGAWGCGAYVAGLGAFYYIPNDYLRGAIEQEQLIPLVSVAVAAVPVVFVTLYLALRSWLPRVHRFIRSWVIGRRTWLVFGFFMHIGIDIGLNVGTFAEVMMAAYFAWPTGDEVDRFWRYLLSRPMTPAERPARPPRAATVRRRGRLGAIIAIFRPVGRFLAWIFRPVVDRLRYRKPGKAYVLHHHPDDASVRRVALVRLWDLGHRVDFVADDAIAPGRIALQIEGEKQQRSGAEAGRALLKIIPGLWWLRPLRHIPLLGPMCGRLGLAILHQRA